MKNNFGLNRKIYMHYTFIKKFGKNEVHILKIVGP